MDGKMKEDGMLGRGVRNAVNRFKKARLMAEDMRKKGKCHKLIPRNAQIINLSSGSSEQPTEKAKRIINHLSQRGELEQYESDESVTQPTSLAVDASHLRNQRDLMIEYEESALMQEEDTDSSVWTGNYAAKE
ncbi:hypothetical protein IFM89_035743 [Coptis chinensis]|uniref:Uncharacterized protein n=1 Tax=Coptis chinensis TaxID=261450 RepID=A0A835GZX9_9MAGN|nr:hypothetical protein IFM89_035743 [Coptis chinensis]